MVGMSTQLPRQTMPVVTFDRNNDDSSPDYGTLSVAQVLFKRRPARTFAGTAHQRPSGSRVR